MPTSEQETEITLGTGRMLAIFFAIVLVCAVFFAIGFSLGKKTSLLGVSGGAPGGNAAAVVRPSAAKDASKPAAQPTDFSFYKAVGSNSANTDLTPPDSQPAASGASAPAAASASSNAAAASGAGGGYFVQVAAVNRQEDAEALVEALKKKHYPAFAANNSSSDKYYHVQVGPYTDLKEAEAMRARLIADGYNPILKK